MMELTSIIIQLLSRTGGGSGEPAADTIRFALPAVFLASTAAMAFIQWRNSRSANDRYILISSLFGFSKEFLMLLLLALGLAGALPFGADGRFFPPAERALASFSTIFLVFAALRFSTRPEEKTAFFIKTSSIAIAAVYIAAAAWPVSRPGSFSFIFWDFWGEPAFRAVTAVVLAWALCILFFSRHAGAVIHRSLVISIALFFLDEVLMIANVVHGPRFATVYAPIRHNFHILAVFFFLVSYWSRVSGPRAEKRLKKLNAVFLGLGPDYYRNIELLTRSCGELLGSSCSFYNRLKDGFLYSTGEWNAPAEFKTIAPPGGAICMDTIKKGKESGIYIVKNLPGSTYFNTDPNIGVCGFKTYIGHPVYCYGKSVGSLCAFFAKDVEFDETDMTVIEMIATAIVIEEERRAAEEQIIKLSQAVEQSPSVVVITDTAGNIEYVNPKFTELTGYEPGEVVGKNPRILKSGEKSAEEYSALWKTILSGKVWRGEFHNKKKNGELYWESASISPIIQKGVITSFIGVKEDISDRKKMQDEMLKISKLDSLSLLAGGIAHDFNNILTGIIGNISLAKIQAGHDSKVYETLSRAEEVSFLARELTKQLQSFSRGGCGEKKTRELKTLIMESADFIARGTSSRCEFKICDDLWPAEINEGQFGQVITNVAINSIQAMPEGGIITISADNFVMEGSGVLPVKPGKYVRISVRDTGHGISPDIIQKIFDPYFTTKAKGSGLGLATVYSIVKNHGGHVTAESAPGGGTTFQLFFPAAVEKKERPACGPREDGSVQKCRGRILFMDDEEQIRDVTAQLLTHMGFEVRPASDGAEALSEYKKAKEGGAPFDMVIMDLTVPGGMGGVEAIKKLVEYDPKAIAIAASGYSDDHEVTANYRKHGFLAFIPKPFKIQDLCQTILKYIGR